MPRLSDIIQRPEWETLILERRKVQMQAAVGPQVAHDAHWQTHMDALTDRLVIGLRSYVYAHRVEEVSRDYTFTTPANWWQHLRERVLDDRGRLDRAILRRWPIRYRSEVVKLTVDRWETFPDNTTVFPESLGQVVYSQEPRW